jgi:hypothetical protein
LATIACSETKYAGVKVAKTQPEYKWVFVAWSEDDSKLTAIRKSIEKSKSSAALAASLDRLQKQAKRSAKSTDDFNLGYTAVWAHLLDPGNSGTAISSESYLSQRPCPASYEYSRMRFLLATLTGVPHNFLGYGADRLLKRDPEDWTVMFLSVKVLMGKWKEQRDIGNERVAKLLKHYPHEWSVALLAGDWNKKLASSSRDPQFMERAMSYYRETLKLCGNSKDAVAITEGQMRIAEATLKEASVWDRKLWDAYQAKKASGK